MSDIRLLTADEWVELRNIRLAALRESPHAFLSTYEREIVYDTNQWRAEFTRGNWYIGTLADRSVSLLGVTREPGMPVHECYLEYLWVSPEHRRSGIAIGMLTMVLERLRAAAVHTVFIWVLDGNDSAKNLYERIGFVGSNHRQPLAERPDRSEEKLILTLAKPGSVTTELVGTMGVAEVTRVVASTTQGLLIARMAGIAPFEEAVLLLREVRRQGVLVNDRYSHHDAIGGSFGKALCEILLVGFSHRQVDEASRRAVHASGGDPAADRDGPPWRCRILSTDEKADVFDKFIIDDSIFELKFPVVGVMHNYCAAIPGIPRLDG